MTDVPATNGNEGERLRQFSSRALAAYALQILSGLDAITAAGQVTDGGQDQGIDALHFDSGTQTYAFTGREAATELSDG